MQDSHRLSQNQTLPAAGNLFAGLTQIPAVRSLARRLEDGGVLPCPGICASAQPFFAALLQKIHPGRPVVIVSGDLKSQESFQQDLETWLGSSPLFYPPWEVFSHEDKLPPADVISDRLQTLVALSSLPTPDSQPSALVVASVTALLQKTFPPDEIQKRIRAIKRGDQINPLDLIEWLEEQSYEPEAQVTQKGEIALRGGILDVWPPTSAWPVRLDFFGDELESLRYFDPLTQISRDETTGVTLPPAGELGVLKSKAQSPKPNAAELATLLDYLPRETIFILCEPEQLAIQADAYEQQIPKGDPFFISWSDFLVELNRRGFTSVELLDDAFPLTPAFSPREKENCSPLSEKSAAEFLSIDFRQTKRHTNGCPLSPRERVRVRRKQAN